MPVAFAGLRESDAVWIPRIVRIDSENWTARALSVDIEAVSKIPNDADFQRFLLGIVAKSDALIKELADGKITPRQWADKFKEILNDGHTDAWVLGRRLAGDLSKVTIDDELVGLAFADSQSDFLLGFLADIENGRYLDDEEKLIVGAVRNRANLYAQVMRGTSGSSFVATSADNEEFEWVMGAVEDHCDDCPYMANSSPWDQSTLFAFPGDGSTKCLGNCKCSLVRKSDKRSSFKPVSI